MEFFAYRIHQYSLGISYEGRDESAGVIGTLATAEPPIGKSETREGIKDVAYAALGRDPTGSIYITDSANRLLEIVFNERYHKDLESQAKWHFMAWALLFLCASTFLGTLVFGLGWIGFGLFLFIAVLYVASVQLKIQNEVESAVVCTIILVLTFLLVPALKDSLRTARQSRSSEATATHGLSNSPF